MGQNSSSKAVSSEPKRSSTSYLPSKQTNYSIRVDENSSNDWTLVYNNSYGQLKKTINEWTNDEFKRIDYLCFDENREAFEFFQHKQYERALQLYRSLSSMRPRNGNLKINLSFCLYLMSRYEDSLLNARQAIDLCAFDTKPKAYFRCGEALIQLKRFEEAIQMFQEVLNYMNDCQITRSRIIAAKQSIERQRVETNRRNMSAMNPLSVPLMQNSSEVLKPNPVSKPNPVLKPNSIISCQTVSDLSEMKANTSVSNNSLDKTDGNERNLNQMNVNSKPIAKSPLNKTMVKSYSTEKINSNNNHNRRQQFNKRQNRSQTKKHYYSQEDIHRMDNNFSDITGIDDSIGITFKSETEALNIYTKMISLSQTDHRLYINRSFYHYLLGNYIFALEDAKQAISLRPREPKAYYRAGLALKALGNLSEAEVMLVKVLEFMPSNHTINNQLIDIRCKALHKISLDEDVLTNNRNNCFDKATNPLKLTALKVRNIDSDARHADLYKIFGKFGKVEKLFFDRVNHCCFVNYLNDESPVEAITALYGYKVKGFCHNSQLPWLFGLVPHRLQRNIFDAMPKTQMKKIINDCGECDDWRQKDCPLKEWCPLKHIPVNKGIETLLSRRPKN